MAHAVALSLIALFVVGLATDRKSRGRLYTLVALPIFFLPFAWYFQITPEPRWIIPLVPLILIHASVGHRPTVRGRGTAAVGHTFQDQREHVSSRQPSVRHWSSPAATSRPPSR